MSLALLISTNLHAQPTATAPAEGDGSAGDPYQIATLENLYWIAADESRWGHHFTQTSDIDASATGEGGDWGSEGWVPIGDNTTLFHGSYNGVGHTISGLTVNRPETDNVGLFGHVGPVDGGREDIVIIRNLGLTDVDITGARGVGGLAGRVTGGENTLIDSCYVAGGSVTGDAAVGGLVGSNNSYFTAEFETRRPEIRSCYAAVDVVFSGVDDDSQKFGGLAGCNQRGIIENSYSRSTVTVEAPGEIEAERVGGLVGCSDISGKIDKCYSTGEITIDGDVTKVGGLLGELGTGSVTESFWDTETSGQSSSAAGAGKTTAEMKSFATYIDNDWDFQCEAENGQDDIWGKNLVDNDGYPFLSWQGFDHSLAGEVSEDQNIACASEPDDITISDYLGTIQWQESTDNENFDNIDGATDGTLPGSTIGTLTEASYFRAEISSGDCTHYSDVVTVTMDAPVAQLPSGSGTSGSPYEIASLENLVWISENSGEWDKYYIQTADIDASGVICLFSGAGWSPIGNSSTRFTGSYDGGGYTISNLYIARPDTDNIGLFGFTNGASISNLGVTDIDIRGKDRVGGLAGTVLGGSVIADCYTTGEVNGFSRVGGLAGRNEGSTVERSYSEADVTGVGTGSGNRERIGGLVGHTINNSNVFESYSTGSVSGKDWVGGLVGHHQTGSDIENSYSRGSVTGTSNIGGLVGRMFDGGNIINSYSTGAVSGTSNVGGLIGSLSGNDNVFDSYWDKGTSGRETSVSGTGKTTGEMKLFATFTGAWDFLCEDENGTDNIWGKNPDENDGYPFLIWQGFDHFIGGVASEDQTICDGTEPDEITLSDYLGDIQWQVSLDNVAFDDIDGATGETLPGNTIGYLGGTRYFRAKVAGTGSGCLDYSNHVTISMFESQEPSEGDGSSGTPYEIASLENLVWIAENDDQWDKHYIQTVNILDANNICQDEQAGWIPIGTSTTPFSGSYDGKGHLINDLFINRPTTDNVGLFGYADGATISNLGLTNVDVTGRDRVGGLVGTNIGNSTIENCYVTGEVTGTTRVGGLVGRNENSTIERSYSETEVTGTGTGSGNNERIGGLVGHSISSSSISLSYSAGNVSGEDWVGGLIGHHQTSSTVEDCYFIGTVTGNDHVGGLAGRLFNGGNVSNSYSTGEVSGISDVGGFIGSSGGTTNTVSNSFWDTETSGQGSSAGGTGKTTAEMKDEDTFTNAGWDFTTIWAIDGTTNQGYPYFSWIVVTWEGTVDDDWHNADNWSTGVIPLLGDYIVIAGSENDPVISNFNVTVNYLVIQENAELIISNNRLLTIRAGGILNIDENGMVTVQPGGSLTAVGEINNEASFGGLVIESDASGSGSIIVSDSGIDATIERYMSGEQWHVISAPVSGLAIGDFITDNDIAQNTSGDYAMNQYVEDKGSGSGGWGDYDYDEATEDLMVSGQGYLTALREFNPLVFKGQLVQSANISISHDAHGWNAIGNPFASAIGVTSTAVSAQNFLGVNAGQLDENFAALYIYDPATKDYKIINNAGDDLDQNYLQPGQGFLVRSAPDGGTINFTGGMQHHHHTSAFFKKSAETRWRIIKLKVTNDYRETETVIRFHRDMTRGLDPTYDAGQYGADPGFRLYTRLVEDDNGINFAIQALPDHGLEDMVIPVGFDFAEGGEVTFSAEELILPPGSDAILEDRALNIFTDLLHDNYTVTLEESSSGTGRFFIHTDIQITSVEEIIDAAGKSLNIYSYGKEIFIQGEVMENSSATLYDLMGRKIRTVILEPAEMNSFRVDDLDRGIYLLRVSGRSVDQIGRLFIE